MYLYLQRKYTLSAYIQPRPGLFCGGVGVRWGPSKFGGVGRAGACLNFWLQRGRGPNCHMIDYQIFSLRVISDQRKCLYSSRMG